MVEKLIVVCLLTFLIHTAETLSYSVRLAGVRSGKLAVALSLTGIIVLVSRTSNLLQGALTGKIIDHAKLNPTFPLEEYFRFILGAASFGTLAAIVLFPTFVFLAARAIAHFEEAGSIPKLMTSVTIDKLKSAKSHLKRPTLPMLLSLRIMGVPKRLLVFNCLATAIYTVGVLASLYAAYQSPFGTAASMSSGLINGVATILLTLFIDPQVALLTDRAMKNEEDRRKLGRIFGLLMFSRLAGTLLAQLFFMPAVYWIELVVRLV